MHALGRHLLLELKSCNAQILNDLKKVQEITVSAAKKARVTILKVSFHRFKPYGISGVVVIAESHLSIHTWPEYQYAAVDIFTCGDVIKPEIAASYLVEKLECKNPSVIEFKRGIFNQGNISLSHKPLNPMSQNV